MQKIILIVIGIGVVGGIAWYFTSSSNPTEEANTSTNVERAEQEAMEEQVEEISGFGSLGNILGFGDNVRCEFKSSYEGQTSEGTFVTDGERFRMEATMQDPQAGVITSNIINDGAFTYTWGTSAEGAMAIKMANPEVDEDEMFDYSNDMSGEESYVDFEQEVEYSCDRWRVDNSAFVPPSDVEFMDMQAMMQEAMQGMPEGFELPEGFPAY